MREDRKVADCGPDRNVFRQHNPERTTTLQLRFCLWGRFNERLWTLNESRQALGWQAWHLHYRSFVGSWSAKILAELARRGLRCTWGGNALRTFLYLQWICCRYFYEWLCANLPLENFTDQKLRNDLCLSVRYIFFKDWIDKKENKLNHKWIEGKGLEKNGL